MISYLVLELLSGITGADHSTLPVDAILSVMLVVFVAVTWRSVEMDISDILMLAALVACFVLCTPTICCGAWILLLPAASWMTAVAFEYLDRGYTPVTIKSAVLSLSIASYEYVMTDCGFGSCLLLAVIAMLALQIVAVLIITFARLIARKK